MIDIGSLAGDALATARREAVRAANMAACGLAVVRLALFVAMGAVGFFAVGVYLWLDTVWPSWAAALGVAAVLALLSMVAVLTILNVTRRLAGPPRLPRPVVPPGPDPLASLLGGGVEAVTGSVRAHPQAAMLMAALAGVVAGALAPRR